MPRARLVNLTNIDDEPLPPARAKALALRELEFLKLIGVTRESEVQRINNEIKRLDRSIAWDRAALEMVKSEERKLLRKQILRHTNQANDLRGRLRMLQEIGGGIPDGRRVAKGMD